MKVTFTRDFDYSPPELKGSVTVAYKAGQTYTLPRPHADAAVSAGAGSVVAEGEGASRAKRPRVKS